HRTTTQRAVTLMRDTGTQAFDLSREPANSAAAYGTSPFGRGCLMARRLVEAGVKFVEVSLGGWDTHQNNFARVRQLSGQVDPGVPSARHRPQPPERRRQRPPDPHRRSPGESGHAIVRGLMLRPVTRGDSWG